MEKTRSHNVLFLASIVLSSLLLVSFSSKSQATTHTLPGQQLAYFVGYHSNGGYRSEGYYYRHYPRYIAPRNYYRKVYFGTTCRKTCWIDRWSGRAIRCYKTC